MVVTLVAIEGRCQGCSEIFTTTTNSRRKWCTDCKKKADRENKRQRKGLRKQQHDLLVQELLGNPKKKLPNSLSSSRRFKDRIRKNEFTLTCGHVVLFRLAPRHNERLWCVRHNDWILYENPSILKRISGVCVNGHILTKENVWIGHDDWKIRCKDCRREQDAKKKSDKSDFEKKKEQLV
jgi:Zn finger protein HypA/HybF involved in hydrogenase expression